MIAICNHNSVIKLIFSSLTDLYGLYRSLSIFIITNSSIIISSNWIITEIIFHPLQFIIYYDVSSN